MTKKATPISNLLITNPNLAQEWHPTKNGNLLPENVTPKAGKKVWWLCKNGHEWLAAIGHRSRGQNCPYCSGRYPSSSRNLLVSKSKLVQEWHPTKNGNLTPIDFTSNSNKTVWWRCKEGHEWATSINNRSNGTGCPDCSGRYPTSSHNLLVINPELAKEWHPTKNHDLTPRNVTPGSEKKVWWICKNDHEWESLVYSRSNGHGCPFCSGRYPTSSHNLLISNPKLAQEWHPTKNGSLLPKNVPPKSNKRIWWRCSYGHEWEASIDHRTRGRGCPYCSGRYPTSIRNLLISNPKLAQEWHPTKNGSLVPNDFTPKSNKKVWWKCSRGHEWTASINNRSTGTNCPYCNSATSQFELRLYSELSYIFPDVEHRKKILGVEIDVYLTSIKLGIEYDGYYFHKNKLRKDIKKQITLKKHGINLIRIRGNGLKKISHDDLIVNEQKLNIKNIQFLLKKLKRYIKDINQIKLLKRYLARTEYINQNFYTKLLDQLPGPPLEKSLQSLMPQLAQEWHPTKNGNLLPENVTPKAGKKVWWLCKKGHEWEAVVNNRSKGIGCPYCSGFYASTSNNLLIVNPQLAQEWHPTKNGNLLPENVTPKAGKKVWWLCKNGHEWEAPVYRRAKSGCPYCAIEKRRKLL